MTAINEIIVNRLKEELTCVICQDIFNDPYSLIPCLHTYCKKCTDDLQGDRCPSCRVNTRESVKSFTVQSFLDIFNQAETVLATLAMPAPIVNQNSNNSNNNNNNNNSSSSRRHRSNSNNNNNNRYQSIRQEDFGSSSQAVRKRPCRHCDPDFTLPTACNLPITNSNQTGEGHLQCYSCREYMPLKGLQNTEPDLSQCCNFCGTTYCDSFWGCKNKSNHAKLFVLNEIEDIKHFITDVEHITARSHGHLNREEIKLLEEYIQNEGETWRLNWKSCLHHFDENIFRTAVARQMVPMAEQIYNTRRLPTDDEYDDDVEDSFYENIDQVGVLPSKHLRACYTCAVNIVNGQFYYYWSRLVGTGIFDDREKCSKGRNCTKQWINAEHAKRRSHTEVERSS